MNRGELSIIKSTHARKMKEDQIAWMIGVQKKVCVVSVDLVGNDGMKLIGGRNGGRRNSREKGESFEGRERQEIVK